MRATTVILAMLLCLMVACSFEGRKQKRLVSQVLTNNVALEEESRALTTGALDALALAPSNPPTDLALEFLRHDQQIEGVPIIRIDVEGILATNRQARAELAARYYVQEEELIRRDELKRKLAETNEELVAMGRLYEAEKNRSIVRRIWMWSIGTFGIAGMIAIGLLCPALIPLFGSLLSSVVAVVPKLASAFGVVGKKAFDGVVQGVENVRHSLKKDEENDGRRTYSSKEVLKILGTEIEKATDANHRQLIRARKDAMRI